MDRVALGRRIKTMRQNLGMTQEEFAEQLNCTNSHIGKIENGKGGISIDLLVSVANTLHTTVDQLHCSVQHVYNQRSLALKRLRERLAKEKENDKP